MTATRILATALVAAACGTAFAQKAAAASDVITIDQTKALNGSVTPNDTAGFPISITAPGSYKLTSNLVVPAGVDGILVTANDVTIDLNGFSITGANVCSGTPSSLTCTTAATRGVSVANISALRLTVHGGSIGGFGTCLDARYNARVTDVSIHNCSSALNALEGSIVSRVGINRAFSAGAIYSSTVDGLQLYWARYGFATSTSILRGVSMANVYQAFQPGGDTNSALSQSVISATLLGTGVQSVGGNLCNGVAC